LAYDLPLGPEDARLAAIEEFRAMAAERRRIALRGARAVAEVRRTGAHLCLGASSIAHLGEMNGLSAWEVRELEHLSLAVAADPALAEAVENGTVPIASGAILGAVSTWPVEARAADPWAAWARTLSTRELRRNFLRRRDEIRASEPIVTVTAHVTRTTREEIDRASELTSRVAHAALTLGQVLGVVVHDWLEERDPLRTTPGTRRLPDTSGIPDSRYVPRDVDRAVRGRSEDRCRVPFCDNAYWVHRSHRVPHREGSSREADALDLLCDYHHALYERGMLRIEGPPDAPIFTDEHGRRLDERTPYTPPQPPSSGGVAESVSAWRAPGRGEVPGLARGRGPPAGRDGRPPVIAVARGRARWRARRGSPWP
jgi:hypothetical protein